VVKYPVQKGLGVDHIAVVVDLRIHLKDVGLVVGVVALITGSDRNVRMAISRLLSRVVPSTAEVVTT
jgi:hypothetical protein